jgi:hypothetical protein
VARKGQDKMLKKVIAMGDNPTKVFLEQTLVDFLE